MSQEFLDFEVANFVCKFGNENMLDRFEDRVYPLFEWELEQKRGEVYKYQFLDVKLGKIDGSTCVYGRIVQRMRIKARQRLKDEEIIPTQDTMLSDPSSIFVLRLADHRFYLIREIPRSPKTPTFQYVFRKLLEQDWDNRYDKALKEFKAEKKKQRLTKEEKTEFEAAFRKAVPEPNLHLTNISDPDALASILDAFALIQSVEVTSHVTNNEDLDLDEDMLNKHQKMLEEMNADSGNVTYKNGRQGLNKKKVSSLVNAAAKSGGNSNFRIKGKSPEGSTITKTERDSRIRLRVPKDPQDSLASLAKKAFAKLADVAAQKLIKVASVANVAAEELRATQTVERIRRSKDSE
jgi:hypothetical protein